MNRGSNRGEAKDRQVVRAGWLVDGTGGAIQAGVGLEICGGVIKTVTAAWKDFGIANGEGLDLAGFTVLPGLADSHVHLTMSGTGDPDVRKAQLHADYEQAAAVMEHHIEQHLAGGVVAVRDGGDAGGHVLQYRRGRSLPILVRSAGRAWRQRGRYGRLIGRPPAPEQGLARAVATDHPMPDHVKIVNSGLNSLRVFGKETPPQFTENEMRGAVAAAADRGLGVMVHANGRAPVAMAVDAGVRSVEHGFFMGAENLARMAEAGTIWVPTAVTMWAYARRLPAQGEEAQMARRNFDHQMEQLRAARRLGVRVAMGTDAGSLGVHHGKAMGREMAIFMEAGWPLAEAVQCGSSGAASLLGGEYTGMVAPGHSATFIAVPGPPEDLPRSLDRVAWIWVDGERRPGCGFSGSGIGTGGAGELDYRRNG